MKSRLARGEVTVGTWVLFVQTPGIVRMIAEAGFDFCALDFQHTGLTSETIGAMCDMARACGITPIVRPASVTQGEVNRLQDAGAVGIMFPDVRSRAEIDSYRSWMLYPPAGERGVGIAGAGSDYDPNRGADALARLNDQALLVIQVEHSDAVKGLDAILEGGGVDLVEIGRNDLATSLGIPGQMDHPLMREAVQEVVECCNRHRVGVGTGVEDA
jgi:2-keto-3-deoxy-L-rhamnonate aldolase RhmA